MGGGRHSGQQELYEHDNASRRPTVLPITVSSSNFLMYAVTGREWEGLLFDEFSAVCPTGKYTV